MIDDYDAAFASFPLLGCVLFRIIDKSKNAVQTNFENHKSLLSIYTRLRTIVKKEVCFLFYKEKRKCVMSNTFTCSKYWSCTTNKKNLNQSEEASSVVRERDILLQCLFSDIGTGFRLDMSGWRIAKYYSTIVKQLA